MRKTTCLMVVLVIFALSAVLAAPNEASGIVPNVVDGENFSDDYRTGFDNGRTNIYAQYASRGNLDAMYQTLIFFDQDHGNRQVNVFCSDFVTRTHEKYDETAALYNKWVPVMDGNLDMVLGDESIPYLLELYPDYCPPGRYCGIMPTGLPYFMPDRELAGRYAVFTNDTREGYMDAVEILTPMYYLNGWLYTTDKMLTSLEMDFGDEQVNKFCRDYVDNATLEYNYRTIEYNKQVKALNDYLTAVYGPGAIGGPALYRHSLYWDERLLRE